MPVSSSIIGENGTEAYKIVTLVDTHIQKYDNLINEIQWVITKL